MQESVLTNARIVTEDEVFLGTVVVRQGRIAAVDRSVAAHGLDLDGDYLLPGLVDVHTDSLEKQFLPRHGVYWPSPLAAAMANDALMSGCGVTTVLDSICAEAFPEEETRRRMFNDCIEAVSCGVQDGLFRSRHRLHLRCETADPRTPAILGSHLDNPLVALASLMDHTPGQRQYRDAEKFREYYADEGWSDEEFGRVVRRLQAESEQYAGPQRSDILRRCRARSIPLASHDDATTKHVAQAHGEGIEISEFPTTAEAAKAARAAGMDVVMGAPNIVLGGSHSGNVSALSVFEQGDLTVLASDYVPSSLLEAPFILHRGHGAPLPRCVGLVTANPARMLGLVDRGRIAEGLLADLVRVRTVDGRAVPLRTWVGARADRITA